MKYKDAVKYLKYNEHDKMWGVEELYKEEMITRIKLRTHNASKVSKTIALDVIKEMDDWIMKVCRGLGWNEDAIYKAKQECHSSAVTSMNLAINIKETPAELIGGAEAHKKLVTYALLGQIYQDVFEKDKNK